MDGFSLGDMLFKLVVAVVLGGLIGFERESHDRPAGLRTHILVCVGAALFTLCSYKLAGARFDPGRVAAQIVTGMGFLGAGTIIRQGSIVRGLTTAASMWTVSGIGIAVAIGGEMLYLAASASVLVFVTLTVVRQAEHSRLLRHSERVMSATVRDASESLCEVLNLLQRHGARIHGVGTEEGGAPSTNIVRVRMRVPRGFDESSAGADLARNENVIDYTWE
ncbi:MAG: hypothetical protein A2Z18_08510 [Armatimonadetes bacterium RBG_16_58_9]|nr:MAG: hypothetical protein A2Z18_08510 [Armatimonadetes bacterium RBG_16_58_9]